MAQPHNIAIFFDGTLNEPDANDTPEAASKHTSVRRLFEECVKDATQHPYYIPGVGTDIRLGGNAEVREAARLPGTPDVLERLRGGLLGHGLVERVMEAYGIICDHYDSTRQDRLFVFGFSRGAFAARSLVNFIDRVGLLFAPKTLRDAAAPPRDRLQWLGQVRNAYQLFEQDLSPDATVLERLLEQIFEPRLLARRREGFSIQTHFLGLWDTVATRGWPRRPSEFIAPRTGDLKESVPATVARARHALAAHEFRTLFEPLMLWEQVNAPHGNIEQRWFPGSHTDVGGGYPASESGLASAPLDWIRAGADMLRLRPRMSPGGAPSSQARLHVEGADTDTGEKLLKWLSKRDGVTLIELSQAFSHRQVRVPLRRLAIRGCLQARAIVNGGPVLLQAAAADRMDDSTRDHVLLSVCRRHASWLNVQSDITPMIDCADRCLFRLIMRRAIGHYRDDLAPSTRGDFDFRLRVYDDGARVTRAMHRLSPADLDLIRMQLQTGQPVGTLTTARTPLTKLLRLEQFYLTAVLAWVLLEWLDVEDNLTKLEVAALATPEDKIDEMSIFVRSLSMRWENLAVFTSGVTSEPARTAEGRCMAIIRRVFKRKAGR